ncbi:MAG: oligopeptide transporter, OPT family, partial [Actinomyces sp.]|nr:oligopeptide transporter, OPT family [Actinomyces sp.]
MSTPTTSTRSSLKELTFRGIIIGGIITLLFTAANVYLGLKVGLTFATSIPAAVISMAILRFFADHTIQENNIVQTIASAAGTLSAVIFILPGLVIVGWWSGFPYWTTMAVCAVGGLLGVMYSIPLRRALVTGSDLPYPEGVAGAEILKVGDAHEKSDDNTLGLHAIIWGAICSAAMSLLSYMKVASSSLSATFKLGAGATSIGTSLSLALIGVGHLVGLTVGIAMLIGMFVSYFILIPYFSAGQLDGSDVSDIVSTVFSSQVRYIGAIK